MSKQVSNITIGSPYNNQKTWKNMNYYFPDETTNTFFLLIYIFVFVKLNKMKRAV